MYCKRCDCVKCTNCIPMKHEKCKAEECIKEKKKKENKNKEINGDRNNKEEMLNRGNISIFYASIQQMQEQLKDLRGQLEVERNKRLFLEKEVENLRNKLEQVTYKKPSLLMLPRNNESPNGVFSGQRNLSSLSLPRITTKPTSTKYSSSTNAPDEFMVSANCDKNMQWGTG